MTAPNHNLVFERGAYFAQPFVYKTRDLALVETPVDITGYAIRMQARADWDAVTVLLDLTTANGGFVITDAANGAFSLILDDSDGTVLVAFDEGVYDIELVPPSGQVKKFLRGGFGVVPEATHD